MTGHGITRERRRHPRLIKATVGDVIEVLWWDPTTDLVTTCRYTAPPADTRRVRARLDVAALDASTPDDTAALDAPLTPPDASA